MQPFLFWSSWVRRKHEEEEEEEAVEAAVAVEVEAFPVAAAHRTAVSPAVVAVVVDNALAVVVPRRVVVDNALPAVVLDRGRAV